ncbi:LysE family translocator [Pikeienuella piscinae]|uniref:LysE family translocator n=1 Tax=Pikeienuella piscinae TaxID=2748098 RepID=A0A7L5BZB6_9RHOB|nr:LysE family translocator [Pikeienuella piscinae]QIE55857.1 LysE family translocator [Pikeienuella piscinae]
MPLDLWLAFAAASAVLLAIPGPTILLVTAYALGAGRRVALWMTLGVFLGDLLAITLSVLGLGALLLASATLFIALKWIGGAYLIWLGWKLLRAPVGGGAIAAKGAGKSGPRMGLHAFAVTATNPKSIVFFIAFLPQFVDPALPAAPQLLALVATFTLLGALNALIYALAAGTLRGRIQRPSVMRWMNRGGGSALIAMGAATLLVRRA